MSGDGWGECSHGIPKYTRCYQCQPDVGPLTQPCRHCGKLPVQSFPFCCQGAEIDSLRKQVRDLRADREILYDRINAMEGNWKDENVRLRSTLEAVTAERDMLASKIYGLAQYAAGMCPDEFPEDVRHVAGHLDQMTDEEYEARNEEDMAHAGGDR